MARLWPLPLRFTPGRRSPGGVLKRSLRSKPLWRTVAMILPDLTPPARRRLRCARPGLLYYTGGKHRTPRLHTQKYYPLQASMRSSRSATLWAAGAAPASSEVRACSEERGGAFRDLSALPLSLCLTLISLTCPHLSAFPYISDLPLLSAFGLPLSL